jgi:hypothetical protein
MRHFCSPRSISETAGLSFVRDKKAEPRHARALTTYKNLDTRMSLSGTAFRRVHRMAIFGRGQVEAIS